MYDVARLAEVDVLQEVAHFELLVLDHPTCVGDVRGWVGEWVVLFDL